MEKLEGNSNNSNGKNKAAVGPHSVSEDSRMRAVSATTQWNKVDETQHEESSEFPIEKMDLLKKKSAEKPGEVFDNADIIILSASDEPKTDNEVQHESAGCLVQNIDQLQGHVNEKATDKKFDNADKSSTSLSDQSQIDLELELFCDEEESDTDVDVEELSTPSSTPLPPVDLAPLWTEGPIVLNVLEMYDQQPEDVIRTLDLLHRLMPEYKYYDADFFDTE